MKTAQNYGNTFQTLEICIYGPWVLGLWYFQQNLYIVKLTAQIKGQ